MSLVLQVDMLAKLLKLEVQAYEKPMKLNYSI